MNEVHLDAHDRKALGFLQIPLWLKLLIFCLAAGLLATLWGYDYSAGNAEEQLPFILRALDPAYLANDFFTNTYSQYGPRIFFSEFVAFFAGIVSLESALFFLTLSANVAIAFLSGLIADFFFPKSRFSVFLAAAGVLSIKTFWLGYSNIIYRNFLEPEHLAMPLILLGCFFILKKKLVLASILFGVASLFHTLLGLELGWILFGSLIILWIVQKIRKQEPSTSIKQLVVSTVILTAFSVALLYPYLLQSSIPSDEFIHLVAYIRHPHHYLPSTFELWQYGQAAVYIVGFALVYRLALKRSRSLGDQKSLYFIVGGLIVLLCVGGYLFVEVWPSRLWVSAQMFRLLFIIKWFSIVLISGWVGDIIENPSQNESRLSGVTAGIALITPITLAFLPLAQCFRGSIFPRLKISQRLLQPIVILLLTIILIVFYKPELRTWLIFLILFAVIWIMYAAKWKPIGLLAAVVLPLGLSAVFLIFAATGSAPAFLKYQVPVFSLFKTSGEAAEVATFAKANTPPDAIFYTPPRMGEFRYMADRAIVVDFAAYPFQDLSMQEWYRRIADCYGVPDKLGFDALAQLNQTVYKISDEELLALSQKYGFSYAMVYDATKTNFPIIFRTQSLKLVQISN